jgi:glycogen operon protein
MNAPDAALRLREGHARVLGAQIEADGVNFALAAPHASCVELCLFDASGTREVARLPLPRRTHGVWHGLLPLAADAAAGLIYGWRVHGPWDPACGQRFNPAKLLLDPCAREVVGRYDGSELHRGHGADGAADARDNAASALKARVVADLPPPPPRPRLDPAQRVIYELHVKGFTALHPDIDPELRGTYAGLAHPAALAHLRELGVTTVSLLPVAASADESRLLAQGLRNYWGYNPVAWSAPDARYWSGRAGTTPRGEFRALVDALHAAGLEVILDVVYNHTAEGDESGPTLSLRGIDNALYYHLPPQDRARYQNWSGCGNSVNLNEPLVLRTALDSLRRWAGEFGVDGFRFDLAASLGRGGAQLRGAFQQHSPFVCALAQDPLLHDRLMIAEPWDVGPGGYQLGGFPPGWLEWNDGFRDTQRAFWLRHEGTRGMFARRLSGSSDVFDPRWRDAIASVNFVAAHDGFTLHDLVSYARRHNQANGEDNHDGHGHNLSVNNGVEGETERADVLAARGAQQRALLAMVLLSLGTPMLLAGDEFGQTQNGNNNAYCQDNATAWLQWARADLKLRDFVRELIALRRRQPLLQTRSWWQSAPDSPGPFAEWFDPPGRPLQPSGWERGGAGALMLRLSDASGALLILVNAAAGSADFCLPEGRWRLVLDSLAGAGGAASARLLQAHEVLAPTAVWVAVREMEES